MYDILSVRTMNHINREARNLSVKITTPEELKKIVIQGNFHNMRNAGLKVYTEIFAIITAFCGYDEEVETWYLAEIKKLHENPTMIIIGLFDRVLCHLEERMNWQGYHVEKNRTYIRVCEGLTRWEIKRADQHTKQMILKRTKKLCTNVGLDFERIFVTSSQHEVWRYI